LIDYFRKYDYHPKLWIQLEKEMERLVRTQGFSQDPIDGGEITRMWILLQYVETIMGRFDEDKSGHLTNLEIWRAFNLYTNWLQPSGPRKSFSFDFISSAHASSIDSKDPQLSTKEIYTAERTNGTNVESAFSPLKRERVTLLKVLSYFANN
jgi:hypothetical protein